MNTKDFSVRSLGPAALASPLELSSKKGDAIPDWVRDDARVLVDVEVGPEGPGPSPASFERGGPRERLFFDPKSTRCALVACGGLCPGLNDVIRAIVLQLRHGYGVPHVLAYPYGYEGLDPASGLSARPLELEDVRDIHRYGGCVIGQSRGRRDVSIMVDTLVRDGVDVLFTLGGDGTLRGAHAIAQEIDRRGLSIAVVGVPKTVDNDIPFVDRTFGFETAVEVARQAVDAAHAEAITARGGVGIVRLMGRDAGFIAAHATLASRDVNFCLVPEVPFALGGERGLLAQLEERLRVRDHAVIVIAEGCASAMIDAATAVRDRSGNVSYSVDGLDIGPMLRHEILSYLAARGVASTVKYIDPSYMIRGVPAGAVDAAFCDAIGRHAVHAAMAGKTDVLVGRWHRVFTHVPLAAVTGEKKRIDPDGQLWLAVLEATGQPAVLC